MCIACSTSVDQARQDAFGQKLLETLNHGMTSLMISLGHRTGLFDVMADQRPRTSQALANDAGLNERYVREWLAGMVVARIVHYDKQSKTHVLPAEHAAWLTRSSPMGNMAIFAQYIAELGSVEDPIVDCFKQGGGVPYSAYKRFHDIMEEDSGQSIVPIIVDKVVPLIPGLHDRLAQGCDVADIGCGRGRALINLAKHYPNSRFTGLDLSPDALNRARAMASDLGLTNITFRAEDLTHWNEPQSYDFITALDAIHDQARPDLVLAAIRKALRPGGAFLMQDIDAHSEPAENMNHPIGAMLYGVSCMHCMTVSLAQNGMGLGTMWGNELATKMVKDAGFDDVKIHRFEHDIQNAYYVMQV